MTFIDCVDICRHNKHDTGEIAADVIFSHGCTESCISCSIKRLPKITDGTIDVLLMLRLFFTHDRQIENVLCYASPCTKASLFFILQVNVIQSSMQGVAGGFM